MTIPPYFPEPTVVPGNVAAERYRTQLQFLRKVSALHLLGVVWTVAIGPLVSTLFEPLVWGLMLAGALVLLSLLRIASYGGAKWDRWFSPILFPLMLLSLGALAYSLGGWSPVFVLCGSASIASVTYAFSCGRDFSFVGQFVMCTIGLVAAAFVGKESFGWGWTDTVRGWLVAMAFLLFTVYDLAAMLSRRRVSEPFLAAVDLWRDILNFTTYTVQVIRHWRNVRM